jgi:hypothetical protein
MVLEPRRQVLWALGFAGLGILRSRASVRSAARCGTITSFPQVEGVSVMSQQGQLIRMRRTGRGGETLWAYRYRMGGRESKRVQRGRFVSERDAADALERALERLRRERRVSRSLTVAELVAAYLAQHDVEPVTIEKLHWLLGKAIARTPRCRPETP